MVANDGRSAWPNDVQDKAKELEERLSAVPASTCPPALRLMMQEFLAQFSRGRVLYYPLLMWSMKNGCSCQVVDDDHGQWPLPVWHGEKDHTNFPYVKFAADAMAMVSKMIRSLDPSRGNRINLGAFADNRTMLEKNMSLIGGESHPRNFLLGTHPKTPPGTTTVFTIPAIMPGPQ